MNKRTATNIEKAFRANAANQTATQRINAQWIKIEQGKAGMMDWLGMEETLRLILADAALSPTGKLALVAEAIGAFTGRGTPEVCAAQTATAALQAMLDAYAPDAERTARATGEESLHSAVRMARAALGKTFTGKPSPPDDNAIFAARLSDFTLRKSVQEYETGPAMTDRQRAMYHAMQNEMKARQGTTND